jgi:hypothetical protein
VIEGFHFSLSETLAEGKTLVIVKPSWPIEGSSIRIIRSSAAVLWTWRLGSSVKSRCVNRNEDERGH